MISLGWIVWDAAAVAPYRARNGSGWRSRKVPFQVAFDQGVAHQRVVIRDTLREVIGI
ncbi:hypothetical protein [Sphingomonas sp. ACRSK]|uniref:hypothetical protein n=1 Tax=Sphingomonas sp. ACRSK TaxID=2918213 RepID=UPI001EF67BB7|nr:hypothetical protein [Sphingomonas sp. ACRSK]MCG7348819.1 hypothetical protein [Sphingomonas sp. ACRSK]